MTDRHSEIRTERVLEDLRSLKDLISKFVPGPPAQQRGVAGWRSLGLSPCHRENQG